MLLLMTGLAVTAEAQDERARLHFQAGASYYEAGDYEDALREFQRSHTLSGRPELFYNFSLCYQQMGDLENATSYLRRYLDEVEDVPNRQNLERRYANLVSRLEAQQAAQTTTTTTTTEPDDGATTTTEPDDGTATTEPDDGATTTAPVSDPEPAESSSGGVHPLVIGGYATAGVGLAFAVTFGAMALGERNSIEDGCGGTRSCASGDVNRLRGLALLADIGLVLVVAGATVGTIFLLRGPGDDDDEEATARFEGPTLELSPYAGPTGGGAVLRGSF